MSGTKSGARRWAEVAAALSAATGALSLGAVLCFWFPAELTTPELRAVYPMRLVRALLLTTIAAAFALGIASLFLARRKSVGGAPSFSPAGECFVDLATRRRRFRNERRFRA